MKDFLKKNIPGMGLLVEGENGIGMFYLLAFALFIIIGLWNLETVFDSLISFLLTLWLFLVDGNHAMHLFHADIYEYCIASIFVISAPILIWSLSKKSYHRLIHEEDIHERSQWRVAWLEFRKHKTGVIGFVAILFFYSVTILCPLLAPYQPNEFQDGLVTKFRPPFTRITVLQLQRPRFGSADLPKLDEHLQLRGLYTYLAQLTRSLKSADFSHLIFVDAYHIEASEVIATIGPTVLKVPIADLIDPEPEIFTSTRLFILGTDSYGRDLLSRIIYGSRISLFLGFIAVLLSVTHGTIIGLLAGYFGRIIDSSLMRFVDILLAFPSLFLILIIIAVFEKVPVPRILLIVVVLGLTSWMGIARLVRGEVLTLKQREFVLAARAIGLGHFRILFRHILPNTLTPIIVNATLRIGGIILIEAALSYLNLGVQQPTASWGSIIFEGKDFLSHAWWISTIPGFAIVLIVVCFNLIGDGLRDAFDPMLKNV